MEAASQPASRTGAAPAPRDQHADLDVLGGDFPAAVFIFQDERNVFVNPAAAALTGYDAGELLNMPFWEVIDPEWRDRIRQNGLARQRGDEVSSSYEVPLRRRDGGRCWVQFDGRRIQYGGRPAVLGVAFDITLRKQVEERLRADEDHYRSLFEHCPDAVFEEDFSGVRTRIDALRHDGVTDFDQWFAQHPGDVLAAAEAVRITEVNSAALRLYGATSKNELLGSFRRLITGAAAVEFFGRELAAWANGATMFEGEIPATRLDGTPIHVWIRCSVAPGCESSLAKLFVSVKDVTREQWATAELRASEERYRTLYENMPAMYFRLDAAGTILAVNEFGARQLGYEPAMLIGQPVLAIFHPEDRTAVLQRMEDANRTTGRVESWKLRKLHRDGRIVWVRENVRRLAGSGHLLVLCEDVTEQRALEERILEICERERESMAGDLHDDLGQRLAGLAYLVRALHLRLQDAGHAEADSALQIAAHADDALARLRALSHVMSAQGVPERGLVPSLRMLAEVFAAIHGIQCRVLADPRVVFDECTHAADLYRIVQEALTNALRHGRARRVEIALALRDGRVVLHVHDDGCGITAAGRDSEGMGLRTMRYRANRLGASFTAQPAASGGFEVLVTLPAPAGTP